MLQEKQRENTINTETYKIIKKTNKHPIITGIIKAIIIIFLLLLILVLIAGGYAAYKVYNIVKDARLSKNDLTIKYENSVVKDMENNTIGILNGNENRESISIKEMPEYLPAAFVAIEDERFYEHKGVDVKRTLRATYTYIKNKGKSPFGGSTITQQMVKNLTQEKEDTWQRKVREMARAYYVEQEMSKEQILELYLNLIFLGDTVYGVEKGSNYYFSKSAKDLDLAECAFLAGINHSPNSYNPFDNNNEEVMDNIKKRTKVVLNKMKELGKIKTEEEYLQAVKEVEAGLNFNKGAFPQTVFSYHTDAAINQIIAQLQKEHDWTYKQAKLYLSSGGFTIYTTQNPKVQTIIDEELSKEKYKQTSRDKKGNPQQSQAAVVLIDHTTGYVLGISGGIGEKTTAFGFNRATDAVRQTGSSMKPIAVLAPAIDQGIITAATVFDDNPTSFNNGTYNPKNFVNKYMGLITTRKAIANSQNIPMVKSMCLLTPEKSIKFLKEIGITTIDDEKDNVLALALGGLTWGVSPVQMAGAYATIANGGVYQAPTFYSKVVDENGNIILKPDQQQKRVMSEEAAYVVKEMLTEAVKTGTSTTCTVDGMSVAAKTGTTNNDYDRWFCAFTPYYTSAVWYGYDDSCTITGWATNPSGQIWTSVMRQLHDGLEPKTFAETKPENVVESVICEKSGFLATSTCKNSRTTRTEYFVKGTEPIQTCPYHSTAKVCIDSGLLATEKCTRTKRVYGRGEYINKNNLWKTRSSYGSPKNVPLQRCTIHQ